MFKLRIWVKLTYKPTQRIKGCGILGLLNDISNAFNAVPPSKSIPNI
jgi:hypothetical protein